ncbi:MULTISPECIES: hypothetical protein [unclassified Corallococcus]|uniref:hypothetical protein n=1 Tax=unclassified Corallococcus TaxID=2685029 RepID=UPI001A90AD6A|nr:MULTISPECIES: hypothetical protein [unclassified Corallococcus]MBN9687103.1 hypothetical protein [Corallococcus sp. NCSPR001]WAS89069.1 hypothetical protein O0N60_19305 [Corallococcus sp. NCRR]
MAELVAWVVELDDEHHEVVFERSEARARVRGARKEGLDARDAKARREPRLDAHAPGPVPAQALLDIGWRFECSYCNHEVDGEGCWRCAEAAEEESGHEEEWAPPVTHGQDVWCSEGCRAAAVRERAERHLTREAALADMRQALPSAEVTSTVVTTGTATVWMRVPGCKSTVRYEWPAGDYLVQVRDHAALLAALRRPALETWESEGGAVPG